MHDGRGYRTRFLALLALFLLASCSSPGGSVASSGDAEIDQTAQFAKYCIDTLRKRNPAQSPSQLVSYMTSPLGKAELLPPSPEFESDAAEIYRGPRPHDKVAITSESEEANPFFERHLVLSGDDTRGKIIAKAYRDLKLRREVFFTWEW